MNEYLFVVGDYLKGKPTYPVIRRLLNLLFSISLTSFLFKIFYFPYRLYDITDYKSIISFFIEGNFFVPFSIFIIIHYFLDWISEGFFALFTLRKSSEIVTEIYNYELNKYDYKSVLGKINNNPFIKMPINFNKSVIGDLIRHLSNEITVVQLQEAEVQLEVQKTNTKESFKLSVKACLTFTVYFFIVPYFGWVLYTLVMIVLFFVAFGLYFSYLIMDILPVIISRFQQHVALYLSFELAKEEK